MDGELTTSDSPGGEKPAEAIIGPELERPGGEVLQLSDVEKREWIQLAQERQRAAHTAWSPVHAAWEKDVNFRSGRNQWSDAAKQLRGDTRPMLTINQLPKFVRQVIGDGRQNKMSIKVRPTEANRSVTRVKNIAGTKDYTMAEIREGQIRNIEARSAAERAYDKVLEHTCEGGFGFLRVIWRYARPDGFERELLIRAVRNPRSVLLDPDAMLADEPNMASAQYGFIAAELDRAVAVARWKNLSSYESYDAKLTWWATTEKARVAEYLNVVDKPTVYVLLSNGAVMTEDDFKVAAEGLASQGVGPVMARNGVKRCVYWSLIDGLQFLEGPVLWPGGYIPIIPCTGPELILNDGVVYESLIRHSHDAQRMFNYWRTAATEAVALAPKAPWVADAKSIEKYIDDYRRSASEPVEVLKYDWREGMTGGSVPPPTRSAPANVPAAEIQQSMQANEDIKSTIGIYDASLGAKSNETSGVAIQRRQQEADVGTFVWHDGLAAAVQHTGVVLSDMIPRVYDGQRTVRLRQPDGADDFVDLSMTTPDGKVIRLDVSAERYDIAVSTGPSYATQRLEAADSMMRFVEAMGKAGAPQVLQAIMDKVAISMDWQGADEIAKRLRKLVPPELLEPSEVEELQRSKDGASEPPPDPAAQQAAEIAKNEADAALIESQAKLIAAKAKLAEAQQLNPEAIKDLVAQAIAEVLPQVMATIGNNS